MRLHVGLALLFAAGTSISAQADTSVVVTGSTVTADFTVNANNYTTDPMNVGVYTYTDSNAMVNGSSDALTISVSLSADLPPGGDILQLTDTAGLDEYFDILANPTLFFDPGPPVMFNEGMFAATDITSCVVGAMDCSSESDATVVSTNITPEPSTLALFGTGVLGMVGVIRRRVQA